jgi:hypothetical protein
MEDISKKELGQKPENSKKIDTENNIQSNKNKNLLNLEEKIARILYFGKNRRCQRDKK